MFSSVTYRILDNYMNVPGTDWLKAYRDLTRQRRAKVDEAVAKAASARAADSSLAADAFVTFALNPDGTIRQVNMAPVSPATDFSFDFQDLLPTPAKVQ
jgi:hypothetical protein